MAITSEDQRPEPPTTGDERATLVGFLQWQRATFEWKCSGLSPDELARRGVEPSEMSLLGLIRHLAYVESVWFRDRLSGLEADKPYRAEERDVAFSGAVAEPAVVQDAWETWREATAFADAFIANASSLDVTGEEEWRGLISLRFVLTHMIEEYARHNGHADLLRERIDGSVGE